MTLTVKKWKTTNNLYTISLLWEKGNTWRIVAYRNTGSDIVQTYDIVKDKEYYSEKSAIAAMKRTIKQLES